MLSDNEILARRIRYGCCALTFAEQVAEARMYGDLKCAEKAQRQWLYMLWAKGVMDTTPTGDEDKCGSVLYATDVALKADCICTSCSGPGGSAPYGGSTSCDIDVSQTVVDAVPVSDRATIEGAGPQTGEAYLIISGTTDGVWSPNTIQTWNGSGWTQTAVVDGEIIATEEVPSPSYWITAPGASLPGLLFPPIDVTWDSVTGIYDFVSEYPAINLYMGRQMVIQVLASSSWLTMYIGPESALATTIQLNLGGLSPLEARVIYYKNDCEWSSDTATTPPSGVCGNLTVSYTSAANCTTGGFTVTANITGAVNFPIGGIAPVIDGIQYPVQPAGLGPTTFGEFPASSVVELRIINSFDAGCTVESDEFRNPVFPAVDHRVYQAVDASFEPSRDPAQSYLIVSNNFDITTGWGLHVGEIWSASGYTTVANGEVTLAAVPGSPTGYWQMVSGTQTLVFAPADVQYNTITQVYTATPPPVATFVEDLGITVSYLCEGGSPTVIYTGPIADFAETSFDPPCNLSSITITTSYASLCLVEVEAEVEPYTPDGEPDDDFSEGGLNNAVYDVLIESDDKIVVGGLFTAYGATTANRFTRLNSDGTLDTDFNTSLGAGFNNAVRAFIKDSQDRYLVVGDFTEFDGTAVGYMARINQDGTLDTTFNTAIGTGFTFPAFYIVDLGDDTYVITGTFNQFNGVAHVGILKIDIDGTVDPTFVGQFSSQAGPIQIDESDGTLIVGNGFSLFYNGTSMFPSGGFGSGRTYIKIDPTTGAIVSQPLLGTRFNTFANPIPLPDGTQIVVGQFTSYNGTPVNRIAKVNTDGTLNATFSTNVGAGFNDETTNAVLMPNGQVMICMTQTATTLNGFPTNTLVLMSQDGVRDTTFNATGVGFAGGRTLFVEQQSNGAIVVVGWFTSHDGLTRLRVSRLQ